jgi:hypothetical protein
VHPFSTSLVLTDHTPRILLVDSGSTRRPVRSMASLSPSRLETLPSETIDQIFFYLVHPRSRLPGLTETQSTYGFPEAEKKAAKDAYNLNRTAPPDMDRYAVDTTM